MKYAIIFVLMLTSPALAADPDPTAPTSVDCNPPPGSALPPDCLPYADTGPPPRAFPNGLPPPTQPQ